MQENSFPLFTHCTLHNLVHQAELDWFWSMKLLNFWHGLNRRTKDESNDFYQIITADFHVIHVHSREYARGRLERRNRFKPADVAFFSSESDKNVALIFSKIRCFNIHFNIHTCLQLVFDLGRSSTRYPSGLHKKSIRGRGPVWEGSWCFPAKN